MSKIWYLSPSNQGTNIGSDGYGNERDQMYALALRYYEGIGMEEDMEQALYWMNLAADAGYQRALEWLEDYCFDDDARVQAYS